MKRYSVLLLGLVLASSVAWSYPREGSIRHINNEIENELVAMRPGEVIVAVLYRVDKRTWGVDIQKVGDLYKSEDEALNACKKNAKVLGAGESRTFRYTYEDATRVLRARAEAAAARPIQRMNDPNKRFDDCMQQCRSAGGEDRQCELYCNGPLGQMGLKWGHALPLPIR
jgi:hypothetical protein